MTEQLVPTVATPWAPADLYAALQSAWRDALGEDPSRVSLLVLVAHSAFETAGGHACWNWNLGNAKHVPGDGHDYYGIRHNEYLHGTWVWVDADSSNPPTDPFRAYASLAQAVPEHLAMLRGRFGYAWPFVEAGDVAGYCHALGIRGYYTAPEAQYFAGVEYWYRKLDALIPAEPEPVADMHPLFVPPDPTPDPA